VTLAFFAERPQYRPTRARASERAGERVPSSSRRGPFSRSVTCRTLKRERECIDEVHFVAKAFANVTHVALSFDTATRMRTPDWKPFFAFADLVGPHKNRCVSWCRLNAADRVYRVYSETCRFIVRRMEFRRLNSDHSLTQSPGDKRFSVNSNLLNRRTRSGRPAALFEY